MNTIDSKISISANIQIELIQHVMLSRYFTAAGVVIVLYDAILTIEDEVRLVWPRPFVALKLLYYINRYWTIASLIAANYLVAGFRPPLSTTFCRYWVFVSTISELVTGMSSSAILIVRVAALYGEIKWVGRCLWILSGLLYTITIALAVNIIKVSYEKFVYEPFSRVCLPVDVTYPSFSPLALPLIFDVAIITLTVFKLFRLASGWRKLPGAEILYTIFRDGFLYFVTIVALRIWTTVIWTALPKSFLYLGVYPYCAILSTMTSRCFLNLRSAGSSTPNSLQSNLTPAFPLGNRQCSPRESGQTTSSPKPTAVTLDTTLFAVTSAMDRSAFSDQDQMLSGDTVETKPGEEFGGGDVESRPRGG